MKKIYLLLASCLLLFSCSDDEDPVVTSISFPNTEESVNVGEQIDLKVNHSPSDLPAPAYVWKSSDESVATVSSGKVSGVKEGTSTITATATELGLSATCTITVKAIGATGIKLSKESFTLKINETETLTYEITPETTTHKEVVWSSSDEKVATVTDGRITAISDGSADIKVKMKDSDVSAICNVTVSIANVESISLDKTNIELENGDSTVLNVTINPSYAKDKKIIWSSSDEMVAIVIDGKVKARQVGSARIKALSNDGNHEAYCDLVVKPASVKGVELDSKTLSLMIGTTKTIKCTVLPEKAANKKVIWSSSNSSIATVSNGVIQGIKRGNATITVKTEDGGFTASCEVTVKDITDYMTLYFPSSGVAIINGFVTGSVYSAIYNNSDYNITITKFEIIDTNINRVVGQNTDSQVLKAHETTNLGGRLNSVYMPKFVWYFTFDGKEYSVSHNYTY